MTFAISGALCLVNGAKADNSRMELQLDQRLHHLQSTRNMMAEFVELLQQDASPVMDKVTSLALSMDGNYWQLVPG